jgi:hypothetical protein
MTQCGVCGVWYHWGRMCGGRKDPQGVWGCATCTLRKPSRGGCVGCKREMNDREDYVQCETCDMWFHTMCFSPPLDVEHFSLDDVRFVCPWC